MVVRMRLNRSQTAQRRSHMALTAAGVQLCECGSPRRAHRACPSCGKYRGKVGIDMTAQAQRLARRQKRHEKELKASGQITADKEVKKS